MPWRVLESTFRGTPGADDDGGLEFTFLDAAYHGFVNAPVDAPARDARVEQVLAVGHVDDLVALVRVLGITGWQPDHDMTIFGKELGADVGPVDLCAKRAGAGQVVHERRIVGRLEHAATDAVHGGLERCEPHVDLADAVIDDYGVRRPAVELFLERPATCLELQRFDHFRRDFDDQFLLVPGVEVADDDELFVGGPARERKHAVVISGDRRVVALHDDTTCAEVHQPRIEVPQGLLIVAERATVKMPAVHPALVRRDAPVVVLGRAQLGRLVEVGVVEVTFFADVLAEVEHRRRAADQCRDDHARLARMPVADEIGAGDAFLVVVLEEVQHVLLDVQHLGVHGRQRIGRGLALHHRFQGIVEPDLVVEVTHATELQVVAV